MKLVGPIHIFLTNERMVFTMANAKAFTNKKYAVKMQVGADIVEVDLTGVKRLSDINGSVRGFLYAYDDQKEGDNKSAYLGYFVWNRKYKNPVVKIGKGEAKQEVKGDELYDFIKKRVGAGYDLKYVVPKSEDDLVGYIILKVCHGLKNVSVQSVVDAYQALDKNGMDKDEIIAALKEAVVESDGTDEAEASSASDADEESDVDDEEDVEE